MRKLLFLVVLALSVALASIAWAQDDADTVTLKSSVAKGGTKKKPKAVAPTWEGIFSGPGGTRAATPFEHNWGWAGVREMGKYFPKCTAEEIDEKQSDADCPKGSAIATGDIVALLGPEDDRASNTRCVKQLTYYNGGAGKMSLFAEGPGDDCAGVGYLAPIPITWKKQGNGSKQFFEFPDNIRSPLPGLVGGFTETRVNFSKATKKVKLKGIKKKVKIGYLTSFGCKGDRTFTFDSVTAGGATRTETVSAGKC